VLPLGAQGGVLACVAAAGRLEGLECLLVGEGPSPPAAPGLTEHAPVSREGAGPRNTGGHGVLPGGRGGSRVEPDRRKNGSSCGAGSGSKGGAVGSGNPPLASLQGFPVARVGPQAPPDCSPSPTVSTMTSLRYLDSQAGHGTPCGCALFTMLLRVIMHGTPCCCECSCTVHHVVASVHARAISGGGLQTSRRLAWLHSAGECL
jgi:hypothetical protein